jgi:hypothetical protein
MQVDVREFQMKPVEQFVQDEPFQVVFEGQVHMKETVSKI